MENFFNFFKKSWQNTAMVLVLILLWILTGISIWYAIVFLLFFWLRGQMEAKPANYKALSVAMLIVFAIALGNATVKKVLPRTASKSVPVLALVDQWFSKGSASNTKIRAQDIFDQSYQDASELVLVEFEALMRQGRVEEASKLLQDFEKKWTFSPFKDSGTSSENSKVSSGSASVSNDSPGVKRAENASLTLYQGSWLVDVSGVSSEIVIKGRPGRNAYSIVPENGVYDYQVLMDGEVLPVQAGPDVRLPDRPEPKFKIIYRGSQPKRLKITVR